MDVKALFWQLAVGAELPAARLGRLIDETGSRGYPRDPVGFFQGCPWLSEAERARTGQVSVEGVSQHTEEGAWVIDSNEFPKALHEAQLGLPALFGWGSRELLDRPIVAVVGTRAASVYGRAASQKFAEALSGAGVVVASGGALGVDAAAHESALQGGFPTVAALASGVDRAYPAVHRTLFGRIRRSGLLVSQFAFGAMPRKQSFLARNRLLAALSLAVLIVEAPEHSGSITVAQAAADLGRHVFVVPANITALNFRGSHALIRTGATLVDHPDQILADLGIARPRVKRSEPAASNGAQDLILGVLGPDPLSTERIAIATGLEPSSVLAELTMLELDGKVIRAAAGYALKP